MRFGRLGRMKHTRPATHYCQDDRPKRYSNNRCSFGRPYGSTSRAFPLRSCSWHNPLGAFDGKQLMQKTFVMSKRLCRTVIYNHALGNKSSISAEPDAAKVEGADFPFHDLQLEANKSKKQVHVSEIEVGSPTEDTCGSSSADAFENTDVQNSVRLNEGVPHVDPMQSESATSALDTPSEPEDSGEQVSWSRSRFDSGKTLPVPDIDLSNESDLDDSTCWQWDQDAGRFRHWDEEDAVWIYYPEEFD